MVFSKLLNLLGFFHCSSSPNPWQMSSGRVILHYSPSPHHSLMRFSACHGAEGAVGLLVPAHPWGFPILHLGPYLSPVAVSTSPTGPGSSSAQPCPAWLWDTKGWARHGPMLALAWPFPWPCSAVPSKGLILNTICRPGSWFHMSLALLSAVFFLM